MSFIIKDDSLEFKGKLEDFKREISIEFANRKVSAKQMAIDNNISVKTLYNWANKYGTYKFMSKKYSIIKRIKLLIEYESLSEADKGVFLRSNGLYDEDLKQWKKEINELPNTPTTKDYTKESVRVSAVKVELRRTKELLGKKNKELQIKDKKLKEMDALLELKKKVDALLVKKDKE
jgi:hypothetical protein